MALSLSIEKAVFFPEDGDVSQEKRAPTNNTEEESLVNSMHKRLEALPKKSNTENQYTIFRVPAKLHKNKENLIEPSVVSIGSYHHGREHVVLMEDLKWLLLQDILSQCNNKVTLETCIEKIKGLQVEARNCYNEKVKMDDDSFVEMLILDGTFIIQFIIKPFSWFKEETGWASTCIATDLIMLENQIPFFIVQSLWELYLDLPIEFDLKKLITRLCIDWKPNWDTTAPRKIHHLLHLCHHYVVPDMSEHKTVLPGCSCLELSNVLNCHSLPSCMSSRSQKSSEYVIPCATELEEAGIKFRKKKSSYKMMDVTFRGGRLEIPPIVLSDDIKPFFTNLLALEQSGSLPGYLTSYVVFMDFIINTQHDVAILQRQGIIENLLSSEEEAARFFNQLCYGAFYGDEHYLSTLFKEVNQYYNLKCQRYRAKLMRDYFNSPWSILSLLGALILLGLTFAQTYYSGYSYYHPSPSSQ